MSTVTSHRRAGNSRFSRERVLERRSAAAFSLVEVAMAFGVVSFCVIVLFGLLSVGISGNKSAMEQAGANQLLSAVVSDLYATPAGAPRGAAATSLQFNIPIPAAGAGATNTLYFSNNFQTTTRAQSLYLVTVTCTAPPNSSTKTATFMDVKVTWPGPSSVKNAAGVVETFVALNRN